MKKIETLLDDIREVLNNGPSDFTEEQFDQFGKNMAEVMKARLTDRSDKSGLRMSNIGTPCNRKLYYTVNSPEEREPLPPEARLKFLYGDLIEELVLFLAELAGHRVEGRQDTQEISGIKGHRDAVIDGEVVDVKSASSFSFKKFEEGRLKDEDPFGYYDQIQSYVHAAQDDPIVTNKDRGHFLVIDKVLGKMCLDTHKKSTFPMEKIYEYKKDMISRDHEPARAYDPVPDGKSGNMKLPLTCSYCDFKNKCHPNLRTFLYANGPVFLTTVKKQPNVPEA